jgi:FkbM family methyltransferase
MLSVRHMNGDYDKSIVREVPREYAGVVDDCRGAVVLDIGAHIGCFTVLALNAGARRVVAIEPGAPSFRMLAKNVRGDDRAEVHRAGIAAGDEGTITLRYLSHGKSMAGAKTVQSTKRKEWNGIPFKYETVDAINFASALRRWKPRVLKMDCEGVEYACLASIDKMPTCVRAFIAEWHYTSRGLGITGYLESTKRLRSWGFTPDREPNLKLIREGRKVVGSNQFFVRPIAWHR